MRNKPQPPRPLAPRLPPSERHRDGLPRCQRWATRDGAFWQCGRAAREGFPTCGHHGAGFPAREKSGIRQNPATAGLKTGLYAKKETVAAFLETQPSLRRRFETYLNSEQLFDFRPTLALAKAILDDLVDKGGFDSLRVIEGAHTVARIGERLAAIEQRLGPVTNADVQHFLNAIATTMALFVPRERVGEAFDHLRALLEPHPGPSAGRETRTAGSPRLGS